MKAYFLYALYIAAVIIIVTVAAILPARSAEITHRLIIEDATGRHEYVQAHKEPITKGWFGRAVDSVHYFPIRHKRIWKWGKRTGQLALWACQIKSAIK